MEKLKILGGSDENVKVSIPSHLLAVSVFEHHLFEMFFFFFCNRDDIKLPTQCLYYWYSKLLPIYCKFLVKTSRHISSSKYGFLDAHPSAIHLFVLPQR